MNCFFFYLPESKDIALSSAESPIKKLTEVPRASSPAPIKADQILHKELLAETGLQVEGKVRFVTTNILIYICHPYVWIF